MIGLMSLKDYAHHLPSEMVDCRPSLLKGNLTVATIGGRALEHGDAHAIRRSLTEAGYVKYSKTLYKLVTP